MDRSSGASENERDQTLGELGDEFLLGSRAEALSALRAAIEEGRGPVLVTGEAGVGKTWLCRRLGPTLRTGWRWVGVDLSPANDPADLHRLIGYALGVENVESAGGARLAAADFLRDSAAEGVRWVLAVDEAHSASAPVLEELRVLANRLGRSDGFAGLVVVGQTALARRLAVRPLTALAARLSARIHLRPLDVEESRILVDRLQSGRRWSLETLERIHRDVFGNPKQLLQFARVDAPRPLPQAPQPAPPPLPAAAPPLETESRDWDLPVLGADKPPLHVEDGLIEVGWDPVPLKTKGEERSEIPLVDAVPHLADETEESIDDHYAALQAWNEWAQNQGRGVGTGTASPLAVRAAQDLGTAESADPADPGGIGVRSETEHGFAPYSQLFSKLRQQKDMNGSE